MRLQDFNGKTRSCVRALNYGDEPIKKVMTDELRLMSDDLNGNVQYKG